MFIGNLLHEDNSMNSLKLGLDFGVSYVIALRNWMNIVGRCSGGLAIIWIKSDPKTLILSVFLNEQQD